MTAVIKKATLATLAIFMFTQGIFAQTPNSIVGKWMGEDNAAKLIDIYLAKDGFYYGKVNNPQFKDYGKILLKKLQYDSKSKTFTGLMTPPNIEISLNVTISVESATKIKLVAKKLLITHTQYLILSKQK